MGGRGHAVADGNRRSPHGSSGGVHTQLQLHPCQDHSNNLGPAENLLGLLGTPHWYVQLLNSSASWLSEGALRD